MQLGKGAYGLVVSATVRKGPDKGQRRAIKIVNKAKLTLQEDEDALFEEVRLLQKVVFRGCHWVDMAWLIALCTLNTTHVSSPPPLHTWHNSWTTPTL